MAGFGRAPIAAAADIGSARRGSFRERDELTDDADLGLPTRGERMQQLYSFRSTSDREVHLREERQESLFSVLLGECQRAIDG
jgi:hypothetical protein